MIMVVEENPVPEVDPADPRDIEDNIGVMVRRFQSRDARSRAWRTLVQGLFLDVAIAVLAVAATQVGDVQWTRAWWAAMGLLLAKTALGSAVSWLHRYLRPPA